MPSELCGIIYSPINTMYFGTDFWVIFRMWRKEKACDEEVNFREVKMKMKKKIGLREKYT